MKKIFFWNNWSRPEKILYLFLLSVFVISLTFLLVSAIIGINAVISWQTLNEIETLRVTIDEFSKALFNFSVDAESYLAKEIFSASPVKINPLSSYIYLGLVMVAMLFLLSTVSFLDLSWYAISMGVFIFFLADMQSELLGVFGFRDIKFLAIMILTYAAPSYYFQAFNRNISFTGRLLTFLSITIILAVLIQLFSGVKYPFLFLSNFGLVVPIAITTLFLIIISFDIIAGFLYLVSASKNASSKGSLLNFSLITLLYLANLFFLLLKKLLYIDWDILYIDAFFLFAVSSVLGIWSYKKRSVLFHEIIPFRPYGAIFYLGLGIISASLMGFSFITGNDPLTECLEYIIIFTHLFMGSIFFLYILINFGELFNSSYHVYDMMYQPRKMPFFMVRGVGFVIIFAMFMYMDRFQYYLARAGYHNSTGDVYNYEGDLLMAREHYLEGVQYEFQNHRSNYSVASLAEQRKDFREAVDYYVRTKRKLPSEFAFVNLARIYRDQNMYFPAMFTLKDGLKIFPESEALHNNLSLLYLEKNFIDSSIHHLDLALKYSDDKITPHTNLLNILTRRGYLDEADSISNAVNFAGNMAWEINKLSIHNFLQKDYPLPLNGKYIRDSLLSKNSFAYLFTFGLNRVKRTGEDFLPRIEEALQYDGNSIFREDLEYLKALHLYYTNEKREAREMLENLRHISGTPEVYENTLGLWMYEHGLYRVAADYFQNAASRSASYHVLLNYAIALLEAGDTDRASLYLLQLQNSENREMVKIAENLSRIISTKDIEKITFWDDALKYQYLYFNGTTLSGENLQRIYQSFAGSDFRMLAAAELMKLYLQRGETEKAESLWKNHIPDEEDEIYAAGMINYSYLLLLEKTERWTELEDRASRLYLPKSLAGFRPLFRAKTAEAGNDTTAALRYYHTALKNKPFSEEVITSLAAFKEKQGKIQEAYTILQEGLQLNPYSVSIIKDYALVSLKMNLFSYAEAVLADLKILTNEKEFREFKAIFEREKKKAEVQFE